MKKLIFALIFVSVIFASIMISAQPIQTVNYTISSSAQGMSIEQLRYTPYPANPGEYVDVWIEAQFYGANPPANATFLLKPKFPFSLDPAESAVQSFGNVGSNIIVLHYKVRIDKNAVPGDNELYLWYSPDGGISNIWTQTPLDIQVQDAQTNFALVVQGSTSSGTSIAIANTGENTANSLIASIPNQPNFRVTGVTNGQILGNLNAGDYTMTTFTLEPTSRDGNHTLEVELNYTDSIGSRRSVMENVDFNPSGTASSYGGNFTGGFSSGQRAYFTHRQSLTSNPWFWIVIGIIMLIGGFAGFNVYRKKRMKNKVPKKQETKKENSKEPDWVTAERSKKRQ